MNKKTLFTSLLGFALFTTSCEKEESIDSFVEFNRPSTAESSPYISSILSYRPAPGQYINKNLGNLASAETIIGGKSGLISLGAWGGSITFTFDHTIINRENDKDFIIYGNAMSSFSEPGIVQVSFDENGNGLADDTWYEIAGSAHTKEETIQNYSVTYTNPNSDTEAVNWTNNQEEAGVFTTSTVNKYPLFIDEQEEVTYTGTKVFPTINNSGFVSTEALAWGYVDNYSEDYSENGNGNVFDIDWAVDSEMNAVNLQGIDFIKVYTAAHEDLGWLGELSTEIKGVQDLSITIDLE